MTIGTSIIGTSNISPSFRLELVIVFANISPPISPNIGIGIGPYHFQSH